MATTVKDNNISDLPEVPVATNDSTTSIINVTVAGSSVPFVIFAFLSNFAILVTALKTHFLQRPSNILLCSLATSDCLVGLVAQPLFFYMVDAYGKSSRLFLLLSITTDLSCLDIQDFSNWIVLDQLDSYQHGSLLCIVLSFVLPWKSHNTRWCIIHFCLWSVLGAFWVDPVDWGVKRP